MDGHDDPDGTVASMAIRSNDERTVWGLLDRPDFPVPAERDEDEAYRSGSDDHSSESDRGARASEAAGDASHVSGGGGDASTDGGGRKLRADQALMEEAISGARATGSELYLDASLDDLKESRTDRERVKAALGGSSDGPDMKPGMMLYFTTGHTDLPGGSSAKEIAAAADRANRGIGPPIYNSAGGIGGDGSGGRHAFGRPHGGGDGAGDSYDGKSVGSSQSGEGDFGGRAGRAGRAESGSLLESESEDFSSAVTRRPGDTSGLSGGGRRRGSAAGGAHRRTSSSRTSVGPSTGAAARSTTRSQNKYGGHNPTMDPTARREAETFYIQDQIRVFMALKTQEGKACVRLRQQTVALQKQIRALELERASLGGRHAVAENEKRVRHAHRVLEKRIVRAKAEKMKAIASNESAKRRIDDLRREKVALLRAVGVLEQDIRDKQTATQLQLRSILDKEEKAQDVEAHTEGVLEQARVELLEMEHAWEALDRQVGKAKFDTALPSPRDGDDEAKAEEARLEQDEARIKKMPKHVPRDPFDKTQTEADSAAETIRRATAAQRRAATQRRRRALGRAAHSQSGPSVGAVPGGGGGAGAAAGKRSGGGAAAKRRHSVVSVASSPPSPGREDGEKGGKRRGESRLGNRARAKERWRNAFLQIRAKQTESRVNTLKGLFERIKQITGVRTPEEFVQKFRQANDDNYALFLRVDRLAKEADDVRAQLEECRVQSRKEALGMRMHESTRRGMMVSVKTGLGQAEEKGMRQVEDLEKLQGITDAMLGGIRTTLDALDLGGAVKQAQRQAPNKAALLQLLFGMLDHRLKQMLAFYARHAGRSHGQQSGGQGGQSSMAAATGANRRGSRASVGGKGGASAMSRAERRRSVDVSVMDIRRGMLLASAGGQGGGGAAAGSAGGSRRAGAAPVLKKQVLSIGPSVPPARPIMGQTRERAGGQSGRRGSVEGGGSHQLSGGMTDSAFEFESMGADSPGSPARGQAGAGARRGSGGGGSRRGS